MRWFDQEGTIRANDVANVPWVVRLNDTTFLSRNPKPVEAESLLGQLISFDADAGELNADLEDPSQAKTTAVASRQRNNTRKVISVRKRLSATEKLGRCFCATALLGHRFFFGAPFSALCLAFRLDSQRPQPASARSSVTTKSLILKALASGFSRAQPIQPYFLKKLVTKNQTTAVTAPAADPTSTCFGVW